jgi:hypothetical protein
VDECQVRTLSSHHLYEVVMHYVGTPAQIARGEDGGMLNLDDNRTRRKNTLGDQSMRRSIQDLVSSVDPNVRIEPEVEDVCLIPKSAPKSEY